MLVLLAAQFGSAPSDPQVIKAAVTIELTHLATLFHDDVMDEADLRRGSDSVNARWGNSVAILAGDFLFAQASLLLAELGPDAVRIQAETFMRLVTGQTAETVGPRPGQDPLEHYLYVITEKTGSLMATSGLFGAMYSGAPTDTASRIARACEQIGVAWQLSDDVIDVASDSAQSGKTPGTDLRQGVPTLPVLYALRSSDPADARLRSLLDGSVSLDDSSVEEALALLRAHHCMAEARADVLSWINSARTELLELPDVSAKAAFLAMCDFVVKRTGLRVVGRLRPRTAAGRDGGVTAEFCRYAEENPAESKVFFRIRVNFRLSRRRGPARAGRSGATS
jgi:heptaprenyl diphosphate synthase